MYRDPSKRQRRYLLLATVFVIVLMAIDYFSGGVIRAPMRAAGLTVWSGAHSIVTRISSAGLFATRARLARENGDLRAQLSSLREEIAAARSISARMEELEEAAHLAAETGGVTAPILSSFRASPYGTFYIGVGSEAGVHEGALVLSTKGFALGRVAETFPSESLVREFFAPGERVEVLIEDRLVSLAGRGGGNAVGEMPRGAHVEVGTMIFARGEGSHAIGIIGHTEGDPTSASVKVYVRSPVNLETIPYVYVVQ